LGAFYLEQHHMEPTSSQDALQQLQGFQKNRRSSQDILGEAEGRLGLPSAQQRLVGLRSAIGNTENLLRGVEGSVTGRTQGSLVTEAQRQRLVNLERQPISDDFREQSRALEGEQSNLSELTGRAMQQAQLGMGEQSSREQYLKSIYDTLFGRETAEKEEKRWWEDFNRRKMESDRTFQAQMSEAAASRAAASQQGAFLRQQYADQRAEAERQAAIGAEAQRQSNLKSTRTAANTANEQVARNTVNSRYNTGNVFSSFGNYIADRGPLALLGGLF